VHNVLDGTAPDDVDTRLSAARRLAALNEARDAQQITAALRVAYPTRPDVTVQSGRIAEDLGQYEDAASLYRLSLAQEHSTGVRRTRWHARARRARRSRTAPQSVDRDRLAARV
jgi:thioredoxin-like negative regulator of GroEL